MFSAEALILGTMYKYQIESYQIMGWFLRRGETWTTRRKTSLGRVENQQTQPTCVTGIEPGPIHVTLETSTFEFLNGGRFTISTQLINLFLMFAIIYVNKVNGRLEIDWKPQTIKGC